MTVAELFPALGLRVEAGPIVLRPITDDILPALLAVAQAGVHDPAMMPFAYPWTDAPADELPLAFVQYHWSNRAEWSQAHWRLEFAVECDGVIVGTQGCTARDYLVPRTVETGSWLGLAHQGRGIGTRMRQAFCALMFDHLDAAEVTSGAFEDNPASLAVSRKVGYRPNGVQRVVRRGQLGINHRLTLAPADLVRGDAITVSGLDAFRNLIGLDGTTPSAH